MGWLNWVGVQVCEHYIDAGHIAEAFSSIIKAEDVLQLETVVLTGLQFDLVVYQPYHFVAAMIEVSLLDVPMGSFCMHTCCPIDSIKMSTLREVPLPGVAGKIVP